MEEEEEGLQLGGKPDWMSRLPEELLDVPLWNLAIPGKRENREVELTGSFWEDSPVKLEHYS